LLSKIIRNESYFKLFLNWHKYHLIACNNLILWSHINAHIFKSFSWLSVKTPKLKIVHLPQYCKRNNIIFSCVSTLKKHLLKLVYSFAKHLLIDCEMKIELFSYIRGWFHQRSTYNFCACRAQKRKMTMLTWLSFFAHSGSTCAKAVHRTLMKLSPGVKLTNILGADFPLKKCFAQFFSTLGKLCNFLVKEKKLLIECWQNWLL